MQRSWSSSVGSANADSGLSRSTGEATPSVRSKYRGPQPTVNRRPDGPHGYVRLQRAERRLEPPNVAHARAPLEVGEEQPVEARGHGIPVSVPREGRLPGVLAHGKAGRLRAERPLPA